MTHTKGACVKVDCYCRGQTLLLLVKLTINLMTMTPYETRKSKLGWINHKLKRDNFYHPSSSPCGRCCEQDFSEFVWSPMSNLTKGHRTIHYNGQGQSIWHKANFEKEATILSFIIHKVVVMDMTRSSPMMTKVCDILGQLWYKYFTSSLIVSTFSHLFNPTNNLRIVERFLGL